MKLYNWEKTNRYHNFNKTVWGLLKPCEIFKIKKYIFFFSYSLFYMARMIPWPTGNFNWAMRNKIIFFLSVCMQKFVSLNILEYNFIQ